MKPSDEIPAFDHTSPRLETAANPPSISTALSKVREKMTPSAQASNQNDGIEGRSTMAPPASWFRRLWNPDDDAIVSILPDSASDFSAPIPVSEPSENHSDIVSDQGLNQKSAQPETTSANFSHVPVFQTASNEVDLSLQNLTLETPATAEIPPDEHAATASGQQPPDTLSVAEPGPATQIVKESIHTVSTFPVTNQHRERPQRPLSFHELYSRLPALPILPAPVMVQPAAAPVVASSTSVASPTLPAPASISAARRAAGQPAPNPFERPSLYRPPTTDESFDAAFTTPPEVTNQQPSGRWDPIPTLRPSGWRDSGSYRAASETGREESWDWTSDKKAPSGVGWTESEAAAPADDSELILTRQWGLLSRFQQSRGLGLANRRTARPSDDAGAPDASDSIPTPNRRKG